MNDILQTIAIFIDAIIVIGIFYLMYIWNKAADKVTEYINEVKYLRSVCEQAILVSERAEKKAEELNNEK